MQKRPSASTVAMSPVRSQPSLVSAVAVASASPRYPSMTCGPRTQISPGAPVAASAPVSASTRRASVFGSRVPMLPWTFSSSSWA